MPKPTNVYCKNYIIFEMLIRVAIGSLAWYMEDMEPFHRYIPDYLMRTELKYPRHDSYVPAKYLWILVVGAPSVVFLISFLCRRDVIDLIESLLSISLALCLNGVITNSIKITVGRPRPDYFFRCYPDGVVATDCTGNIDDVMDGRKSFPSGHSSFSYCSMGFLYLYLAGRVGLLIPRGKRCGINIIVCLLPLLIALYVVISRTCDYHHHWLDVTAGSILGYVIGYMCYRHYYHALTSELSGVPYAATHGHASPDDAGECSTPLLSKYTKWI